MDLEKTSISYDEKVLMYKIDYGFYTKYFDSFVLYYKTEGIRKVFGRTTSNILFDEDFDLDNYIVGFTNFFDKTSVCLIDLDNFYTRYFIVKTCYFFDYTIKGKKYLFFIYSDENGQENLFQNCNLLDIEIIFDKKIFQNTKTKCDIKIENKVLGVQILYKIIYLPEIGDKQIVSTEKELDLSIFDLFYFEDYFCGINPDFTLFELINNQIFKVGQTYIKVIINKYDDIFYPKYKINFLINSLDIDNIDITDIIKVFLSFYPKQYLSYAIDNENIQKQLNGYFTNINKLNFEEIDLDFKLPDNIFQFDKKFNNFQENLNKLKYLYFSLKNALNLIENNLVDNKDKLFIEATKIRLKMNRQTLEVTIAKYEKMLSEIIINIFKKQI